MIEARATLIRIPGGGVRVLRLVAVHGSCWPLAYDVPRGERMCRSCGCTDIFGCSGGCSWVSPTHDLCTRCYKKGMLL